jgi:hypothetical protein
VPEPARRRRSKDDRTWRIGTDKDVASINDGISEGLSITASIPPIFAAYATLAFPLGLEASRDQMRPAEDRFDDALLRVLCAHTQPQPWWLGFLDTGASDVGLDDAPRVAVEPARRHAQAAEALAGERFRGAYPPTPHASSAHGFNGAGCWHWIESAVAARVLINAAAPGILTREAPAPE